MQVLQSGSTYLTSRSWHHPQSRPHHRFNTDLRTSVSVSQCRKSFEAGTCSTEGRRKSPRTGPGRESRNLTTMPRSKPDHRAVNPVSKPRQSPPKESCPKPEGVNDGRLGVYSSALTLSVRDTDRRSAATVPALALDAVRDPVDTDVVIATCTFSRTARPTQAASGLESP
jgi:hypothetical protein